MPIDEQFHRAESLGRVLHRTTLCFLSLLVSTLQAVDVVPWESCDSVPIDLQSSVATNKASMSRRIEMSAIATREIERWKLDNDSQILLDMSVPRSTIGVILRGAASKCLDHQSVLLIHEEIHLPHELGVWAPS
jgi:hypothetical protein